MPRKTAKKVMPKRKSAPDPVNLINVNPFAPPEDEKPKRQARVNPWKKQKGGIRITAKTPRLR